MQSRAMTKGDYGRFFVGFLAATVDIMDFIGIAFVIPFIATQIYPSHEFAKSLLVVVGAFAASALVRPIGGPILGSVSDRLGRKKGLYIMLLGLAATAVLTGLTPTYAQWGIGAPIYLILVRIIQGFFVAGVVAGSYSIGVESFPERWRGFLAGLTGMGGSMAHLAGSLVFLAATIMFTGGAFATTGWRFMFFGLAIFTLIILAFTYFVGESPTFEETRAKHKLVKAPVRSIFSKVGGMRRLTLAATIMVTGSLGFAFVVNTFPTYLAVAVKLSAKETALVVSYSSVIGVIGSVVAGTILHLYRKLKYLMATYAIIFTVLSIPLYFLAAPSVRGSFTTIFALTSLFYLFSYINNPSTQLFLNEAYPTGMRVTGLGWNWNWGFLVSGTVPVFVTYLLTVYGIGSYPILNLITAAALGIIYLIGVALVPEVRGNIQKELQGMEASPAPSSS